MPNSVWMHLYILKCSFAFRETVSLPFLICNFAFFCSKDQWICLWAVWHLLYCSCINGALLIPNSTCQSSVKLLFLLQGTFYCCCQISVKHCCFLLSQVSFFVPFHTANVVPMDCMFYNEFTYVAKYCSDHCLYYPLFFLINKYTHIFSSAGDSRASNEEKSDESLHCSGSGAFSSQALLLPIGSDSIMDDLPCTSGSTVDFDSSSSFGSEISRFKSYPFVADVNSLAWGVCGDTYNLHEDSLFREFLFVSGNHGVTVHAFCKPYRNTATTRIESEGEFGDGSWVEWGPSATLVRNMEVEKAASSCHDARKNVEDVKMANGNSETPDIVSSMGGNDEFARGVASKRWLQSFCTKVEDIETDGKVWTRFPEKSSFPCSAKVVSFSIFSNFPFMDFLPQSNSLSNKDHLQERVHDSVGDPSANLEFPLSGLNFRPKILSNTFGVGMDSLYKCSRVFSSNSHNFVGFVLTLKDPVSINNSDGSERSMYKNIVLVARLDSWGIQWVSSIKLEESLNTDLLVEWTDFCFSENLLVCLNSCGLIVFYSATSGECVVHLDILWTCGDKLQSDFLEKNKFSVGADRKSIQVDLVQDRLTYQSGNCFGRRNFNKLITASHTSLFAVVDDYGVVYVICAGDYLGEEHHKYELLPHFQHLGLGMLVGWEVGGFEIGCQRMYSDFDGYSISNASSIGKGYFPFLNNSGDSSFIKFQEGKLHGKGKQYSSRLSGFSAASETNQVFRGVDVKPHLMRKIFLPTCKFNEDDSIYFSPFGITRLMRKHNLKDQKGSQIVHFNLHGELTVCDDSFLNSGCEMFYLQGRETFIGDAVGCTFQGCFYLVTEGGLSVVLPSLSLSSNFFPVESIGYRQSSNNSCTEYQLNHNLEMKYSKQPWLPWNIEVLDRVLLYESTEEADHLCLENGENNWRCMTFCMLQYIYFIPHIRIERLLNFSYQLVSFCWIIVSFST